MYVPLKLAAVTLLPLLHPTLPIIATQMHPQPITISGVACASAHDMVGLYQLNATQSVKTAQDLLGLGRDAGLRCEVLQNVTVFNWGQVTGPEGAIHTSGGKTIAIVEVVQRDDASQTYFLVAKTQ